MDVADWYLFYRILSRLLEIQELIEDLEISRWVLGTWRMGEPSLP